MSFVDKLRDMNKDYYSSWISTHQKDIDELKNVCKDATQRGYTMVALICQEEANNNTFYVVENVGSKYINDTMLKDLIHNKELANQIFELLGLLPIKESCDTCRYDKPKSITPTHVTYFYYIFSWGG